ncbi:PREDICTED: fatty aldehyde dehydrogenase-like, partial [Priapulus caudatus]|uniref:Aldehyde dehydrogenase n=1 Tax=Priapulus caudatus TaxID=37621 RepID=A0ABM1EG78_PRICU
MRSVFYTGRTRDIVFRKKQLQNLVRLIDENREAMCEALFKDLHKPKFESVMYETDFVKSDLMNCIYNLDKWTSLEKVSKNIPTMLDSAYLQPEPYGVVLILGAWNYPIQLTLCPLIGAIAAGNCAIIKPSEVSPATAELVEKLIPSYLDPECFKVVNGGVPETTALLDEKFDYILYTGSPAVGKIVYQAAAKHLTPVTLELGGKNPTYVDKKCDMRVAARRIAWGKWCNSGQICISPDYVLIEKNSQDAFVEEIKKAVSEFYGENPKESEDYCRMVNNRHLQRVKKLMENGKVIYGGEVDEESNYIAPTILVDLDPDHPAMQEEIFGPILVIQNINDLDDAVTYINEREKPLTLYAFGSDKKELEQFVHRTSSGSVVINDTLIHASLHSFPFGGVGQSGMGGYHGKYSFDTFSHKKPCLVKDQSLERINNLRYPPYNENKLW